MLASLWAPALSQDASEMDPVVISASLSPEKSSATGRNLLVIRGEKFATLPVHSVDELLRYIPGVEMQMRGPLGAQSDLVIRGGTFQQVLVVLDGVRLNDPNTGHFSSYIPIAPTEIDRIEVLKGASSAVYGSEAVGGVVHIITKSFAATQQPARSAFEAQVGAGEYNLLAANAGGVHHANKNTIAGGLVINRTSGQLQRGTRGYVYSHTASASLMHRFSEKISLGFRTAYDDRDFSAQNFYTTFISDTSKERVKTWWNQLQVQYNGNAHTLRFAAAYKNLEDWFKFNGKASANQSTSRLAQALITDHWRLSNTTSIVSGTQFVNKNIESNDRGNHNVRQAGLFAILNTVVANNLHLSPSLRMEWNEASGWELIPQASASYKTRFVHLRANAGKTTRDADFTERYNNYNKTLVTSGRMGNPWLNSERSFSYEGGVDIFALSNLKLSATWFRRDHSDLIDYVPTPYAEMPRKTNLVPTGTYALAKNIAEVNTTGFETDIQFSTSMGNGNKLWSTLGFVWLNSVSSNATPSFYISSHARYLTNFNTVFESNRFSLALNGVYKNRQPQAASAAIAKVNSDYFVANAKLHVFVIPARFGVFAELNNITNTKYADLLGSQMPGRWFLGGLRINL